MIYGEDEDLNGEWDLVTHLPKSDEGYFGLSPADIVEARELLDGATKAIGRKENQITSD